MGSLRLGYRTWIFLIAASCGGIIIVVGNALMSMASSVELRTAGTGLRQLGLSLCVLTGVAFLMSQYQGRIRRFTTAQLANRSNETSDIVPSPLLVALIRVYCLLLISCGGLVCISWGWYSGWFGPVRFLFMAAQVALFVAPGFLIWTMTNTIVRIAFKLEEVSGTVKELQSGRSDPRTSDCVADS